MFWFSYVSVLQQTEGGEGAIVVANKFYYRAALFGQSIACYGDYKRRYGMLHS